MRREVCYVSALRRLSQAKGEASMNSDPKTENGGQITDGELSSDELDKVSGGEGISVLHALLGDTPTSQLVSTGAATGAAGGAAVFGSSVPGGADAGAGAGSGAAGGAHKPA